MTGTPLTQTAYSSRPTLSDRASTLASWALGGTLFLTFGWLAMEPDDPLEAVSLLTRTDASMMLLQAGALAGVTSALGTALAGRRRVDIGAFAAALGMAAVSLRGGTTMYLLLDCAEVGSTAERGLALKFAAESVGWFAVVALSLVVSALVMRWLYGSDEHDAGEERENPAHGLPTPAAYDVPGFAGRLFGIPLDRQTRASEGFRHAAVAVVVGLIAVGFFSGGLSARTIRHGQACFVVAAAVGIACYAAHRLAPVRSALWSILAVLAIPVIGYLWAGVRPAIQGLPPTTPSSVFVRVLPIQYISIGTATALAMFWRARALGGEYTAHVRPRADRPVPRAHRV